MSDLLWARLKSTIDAVRMHRDQLAIITAQVGGVDLPAEDRQRLIRYRQAALASLNERAIETLAALIRER